MRQSSRQDSRLAALARVPLFAKLSPEVLKVVARQMIFQRLVPGEILFSEGQSCHGLYVVDSGLVRLYKLSRDGREQVLATLGPGSTLSELPLIDGGSFPSCAAAVEESTVLSISSQTLRKLCSKDPDCTMQVLGIVADRLRTALGMVAELSFATVRSWLAAYLLRASALGPACAAKLPLPANHEIAAQIGTVRELVSRHLSYFQAKNIIRLVGREVCILDFNTLIAEAKGLDSRPKQQRRPA